jgi:hypothetical protein
MLGNVACHQGSNHELSHFSVFRDVLDCVCSSKGKAEGVLE